MRRKNNYANPSCFKILLLDDDKRLVNSIEAYLTRSGYQVLGFTDSGEAVERIRREEFDLLILDFIMSPLNGDKIVDIIRAFDTELYILLLTGHKDLAPPIETIKALDIQGYCEKSDNFDQLSLLVESACKSVIQMRTIKRFRDELRRKNDELNQTYDELRSRYIDTIEALRLTVDAKDVYTRGHSDRVAHLAVKIGQHFQLSESELELLRIGGIFHDIGKIGTTDDILLKTGSLEEREYTEIKKHPLKGAHILSAVAMFKDVVPLVECHHERIDGKGYPHQLSGDFIPFLARILSVADAFDAMVSDRLYRSHLNLDEAKNQLVSGSGTQFDAQVVDAFLDILKDFDTIQAEIAYSFDKAQGG